MVPNYIPINYYDGWGDDGFNNFIIEVIKKVYQADNLILGPSKGLDGGIDAEYVRANEVPFIIQIKWREISRYDQTNLRNEIFSKFKNGIADKSSSLSAFKYLFITNVSLTNKYHENFKKVIRNGSNFDIEYWEFEKINSFLRQYDDLYKKFCPYFSKPEIEALEMEKNKTISELKNNYEKRISETEFLEIQYKVKNLYIDKKLQMEYYYAFIFFLGPVYMDEKNNSDRKILRKLLDLSEKEEIDFIESLKRSGDMEQTENLLTVNDRKKAKDLLNKFINGLQIPLEKVIDMFEKWS